MRATRVAGMIAAIGMLLGAAACGGETPNTPPAEANNG